MAGMTDYTGVSMDAILAHIRDWRDETAKCVEALKRLQEEVRRHREQLDQPDEIAVYAGFFIDLLRSVPSPGTSGSPRSRVSRSVQGQ